MRRRAHDVVAHSARCAQRDVLDRLAPWLLFLARPNANTLRHAAICWLVPRFATGRRGHGGEGEHALIESTCSAPAPATRCRYAMQCSCSPSRWLLRAAPRGSAPVLLSRTPAVGAASRAQVTCRHAAPPLDADELRGGGTGAARYFGEFRWRAPTTHRGVRLREFQRCCTSADASRRGIRLRHIYALASSYRCLSTSSPRHAAAPSLCALQEFFWPPSIFAPSIAYIYAVSHFGAPIARRWRWARFFAAAGAQRTSHGAVDFRQLHHAE